MIDTWDLQEGLLIDARKLQEGLLIYTRDLQLEGYRHIYVIGRRELGEHFVYAH